MPKRLDVALNPKLDPFIQKALENPNVKRMLAYYGLKENAQGVARLALIRFLQDIGVVPDMNLNRHTDSKKE